MSDKPEIFDSMRAASKVMGIPMPMLRAAKDGGCQGFRYGRVHGAEVREWLAANPDAKGVNKERTATGMKAKLVKEQWRKLKIVNDQREGRLIQRAWVAERFRVAGSEMQSMRVRSEQEDPMRFARFCPGADVAACRSIVRGIWDGIFASMASLGKHFDEGPGAPRLQPETTGAHRERKVKATTKRRTK